VFIYKADNGERIGVKKRPEIPVGCLFDFAESFRTTCFGKREAPFAANGVGAPIA
jgi:hypothetical protein